MANDTQASIPALTAFVVYLSHFGHWSVVRDLGNVTFVVERPATADDIYAGSSVIRDGDRTSNSYGVIEAIVAFLVYQTPEGQRVVHPDPRALTVLPSRPATLDEVWGDGAVIQRDLTAQATAQVTQMVMMQTAQAMQEQAANQKIMSQISKDQSYGQHKSGLILGRR